MSDTSMKFFALLAVVLWIYSTGLFLLIAAVNH